MISRLLYKTIKEKVVDQINGLDKVVILYGPRQVGKTTLVKQLISEYPGKSVYINCDEPDVSDHLVNRTSTEIKSFLGDAELVVLDEAQRITNIGLVLKLLVDSFPDLRIIVTGSSAFELANQIVEPLTGRNIKYLLFPLSHSELTGYVGSLEETRLLEERLIWGGYPQVITTVNYDEKRQILRNLAGDNLFRDIFKFEEVKSPDVLRKLLQALALQIGQEISYNELANLVGIDKNSVIRYLDLFEKSFITFRLSPFSRNLRKEIGKLRKIYFYDLGLRNALINNFNGLDLRQDSGHLWENYMVVERMKRNSYLNIDPNYYFWRTYDQQELDLVEEMDGRLNGYEFKYTSGKSRSPQAWKIAYPESGFTLVNRSNYSEFLN